MNKLSVINGLAGKGVVSATASGSGLPRDVNCNPHSPQSQGMMYGAQTLWLAGKLPDWARPTSPEYIVLVIAAVMFCLFLLWNFILRKRVAKYRNYSSNQGERYRQFFDNCPDALLVVEREGSITTANARASTLLKIDGQELLAENFWNFVTGVSRSEFGQQFSQCMSGKPMHCEGYIEARNGTVVPVVVNGSLQHVDGKSLVQLYIRDNSAIREVEDQVRVLYNQLDKVTADLEEKAKMVTEEKRLARREFITLANHQIRTPLDGIMGMAHLLADSPLSVDQHNCVYTILKSSASLLKVIQSMSEAPEDAGDAHDQSKSVGDPQPGNVQDALVLVVDDNKICQKVVAALLRKAGCKVDAVENGKDALSQVRQKPYDVILMDCQMPVLDGFEATARIRAMPEPSCSIPIVALTAHSLQHELQACRDCGMDDHLVKPVDRQMLIHTVNKYAHMSRQRSVPTYSAAS